ncbi:DUF2946 family protein [Xanthomonas prunicola]|uniref:DUF2946 family protein n=1 Tax=Xanthomonas prunicola TaxID=2053930 RepID=UPI0021B24E2F|nr:DUF2946 family protein [Xanthomonas prunicola]UXA54687.1 DUF2946 family protein [Xanthomonas prunicola]
MHAARCRVRTRVSGCDEGSQVAWRFFITLCRVRLRSSPLFSMMQRLACLALLLLLVAPLVSRTLENAASVLDGPLCHSQPWQAGEALDAVGGKAHAAQRSADVLTATAERWLGDKQDLRHADGGHAVACDYCLLAARLLPWLLLACLLWALSRCRLAVARLAIASPIAARWWAHAPRGPP